MSFSSLCGSIFRCDPPAGHPQSKQSAGEQRGRFRDQNKSYCDWALLPCSLWWRRICDDTMSGWRNFRALPALRKECGDTSLPNHLQCSSKENHICCADNAKQVIEFCGSQIFGSLVKEIKKNSLLFNNYDETVMLPMLSKLCICLR